jgi:hypothetical protein
MSYKKNKFSKALNHDLNIYKCILNFISTLMSSFKTEDQKQFRASEILGKDTIILEINTLCSYLLMAWSWIVNKQ